jgi:hypothetical protein
MLWLAASAAGGDLKTSWFGNGFSGKDAWVQNDIIDLYVAPGGTCYTISRWDEAHHETGMYKDGKKIGRCGNLKGLAVGSDGTCGSRRLA